MKKIKNKNKLLISLVALFTMLMCTSVGFATWITTGGSNSIVSGNIEADEVYDGSASGLEIITINNLNEYEYNQDYGFVDEGKFGATLQLSGDCSFNSTSARQDINSYRSNSSFDLEVKLSTAITGGFSANNLSSSLISATSANFVSSPSVVPTSNQDIIGTMYIQCNNNNTNFDFTFTISLTWTGNDLSLLPDISTAGFSVSLLAKEHRS